MPFKRLDSNLWSKMVRRVLIIGGPNTYKTTALVKTFTRPLHILSYPGEKGTGVIPYNQPDLTADIWEVDDFKKENIYANTIREIEEQTWKCLATPGLKTFAGEGLHKLASLYWNREYQKLYVANEEAIAKGARDRNGVLISEAIKLSAYGNENFGATREILAYISKVCQSGIENVVFTCWEGVEAGETGNAKLDSNSNPHLFADLPGRLARKIVGEFGIVMYAEVGLPDPKGRTESSWQIRKHGKVWGVGTKLPYEIAIKLPTKVPQDWQKLLPLLDYAVENPAPKVETTQTGPNSAQTTATFPSPPGPQSTPSPGVVRTPQGSNWPHGMGDPK